MLLELVIENYAVVDRLRVRFHPGLNLLTGETGSGKSIVVDALGLLFGGRASVLRTLLGAEPFFLVTSAGHMPRAMGVFVKQGSRPIPAPTDFSLPKDPLAAHIAPNPLHLYYSDLAINEYAGLLWYYLTDKI